MKKQLLLLMLLCFGFATSTINAQLSPGDIVVIGLAADAGPNPSVDEFAWVPLVNLPQGTTIYFTDSGWNSIDNKFMGFGDTGEILLRYVAPTFIDAGTIMLVTEASLPPGYTAIPGTQCGNDSFITFPNAGDQMIVFQSSATIGPNFPGTNFTPIFALTTSSRKWESLTMSISQINAAGSDLDNVTNLPPGLTYASAIAVGNSDIYNDEADNVRYQGATSGTRAQLLASITNYSNWGRYDVAGNYPDLFIGAEPTGWTKNGATAFSVIGSDVTPPAVSSFTRNGSPTPTAETISYTITFNESVSNLSTDDFSVTTTGTANAVVSSVSATSGTSMTIILSSISGSGSIRPDLKANTNIIDQFNNGNGNNGYVASYTNAPVHNVDRDRPGVAITSPLPNPTNATGIQVNFTFTESVSGFVAGDVTVTNGTLSTLVGSGANYSGTITPTADGTVTVNVPVAVAQDAAGNTNTAAPQFTIVSDRTQPTVSMSSTQSSPTNVNSFTVNINFSSDVLNFTIGDILASNATLNTFAGSGANYSVQVVPTTNGTVTLNIPAGAANDTAGNTNPAAAPFSIVSDKVQPSVAISSAQSSPTNSTLVTISIAFSKTVTGFSSGDLQVSNGSITSFFGSGMDYFAVVSPIGNGNVSVSIPAGAANDAAGNSNLASNTYSFVYDSTAPTVSISSPLSSPTNVLSIPLIINFNESVLNFAVNDISVSNGILSGFSGSGSAYMVNVTPISDGTITVNINASVANDQAGNGNSAATAFTITSDRSRPTAVFSSVTTNPTNANPIPVTLTYNEAVTGMAVTDLMISNASIADFSGSGSTYSFNLIPASNGTVSVELAIDAAVDAAGNTSSGPYFFSREYDTAPPTVSLSSATASPTNLGSIAVDVNFSESVSGFMIDDIQVTNGSANSLSGSGSSYSFNLVPAANGSVTVNIAAGVSSDVAGNGNAAATPFSIEYDAAAPVAVISSSISSPTTVTEIPLTFSFNESVTGFDADDIIVTNGIISGFSGSGAEYTATLIVSGPGMATVNINANVAVDSAGNNNTAAAQFSILLDLSGAVPSISSTVAGLTNLLSFPVYVNFDKVVTGFTSEDVVIGNGSISNFAGTGTSYSFIVTPIETGLVTIDIPAGVAVDNAGNDNSEAVQFSVMSDNTPPSVVVSTPSSVTNAQSVPVTFTFNEDVTNFTAADIIVINGALTNFQGSGSVYTATLSPVADGPVTIFILGSSFTDLAGNFNSLFSYTITADYTRPTASISWNLISPVSVTPIPITITFSEAVTGFVVSDIIVTGGTLADFSGSGSTYTVNFIPTSTGTKTINVPVNVAADAAGNLNFAAAQFTFIFITPCSLTTTWNGLFWTNGEPVANQPAVISASLVITEDFSACKLTVGNGATVYVLSGVDLNISGDIIVQSDSQLIFENNANLIQTSNAAINSGNIVSTRNAIMKRLDYVYWSSPVSGQNLYAFSPLTLTNRFYQIDELTNTFVTPTTSNFIPGTGYAIRAPNTFPEDSTPTLFAGQFKGVPNNGQISVPATQNGLGYNLIGNPYPSPISADLFLEQNPGTLYFYTHQTSAAGGSNYAVYNETGTAAPSGGEVPNGLIQTGQGFLFKPVTPSAGVAVFENTMRTGDNTGQFFRNSNQEKHRLWISLTAGDTMMNQMLLGYVAGATNDVDLDTDGPLNYTGSSISSRLNNSNYVIQGRALPFEDSDLVPLNFKAETEGLFQLKLDHVDGLFAEGQQVYLEDSMTQSIHNLADGPYNFTSMAGNFSERFTIRYQYTTLGVPQNTIGNSQVLSYKDHGVLTINSSMEKITAVDIYDIGGRLIYSKSEMSAMDIKLTDLRAENQILIVKTTTTAGVHSSKVAY